MFKIAFITADVNRDGAGKVISVLANYYAAQNWKVDFITKETIINGYPLNPDISIIEFGKSGQSRNLKFLSALRRYLRTAKPNVIVSFLTLINLYTIIANIGLRNKLIISERSDPVYIEAKWQFACSRLFYSLADVIVFQSRRVAAYYSPRVKARAVILLNPIEITCRKSADEEKKIVTAGRFVKAKNHIMLIEAFAEVYREHPDYLLYLYGDGELREEYQDKIKLLGLQDAVVMPGNVTDIHERIADAQIFVLSSDVEGLSNALLEAMAMGLPCVSTRSGGTAEVIEDQMNGILIDVGDKQALVRAFMELINDRDKRKYLGKEAQIKSKVFLKENIIKQWAKIIER